MHLFMGTPSEEAGYTYRISMGWMAIRIYNTLVMLGYLMDRLGPNSWKQRLHTLLLEHPDVNPRAMGFPTEWLDRPIWRDMKTPI